MLTMVSKGLPAEVKVNKSNQGLHHHHSLLKMDQQGAASQLIQKYLHHHCGQNVKWKDSTKRTSGPCTRTGPEEGRVYSFGKQMLKINMYQSIFCKLFYVVFDGPSEAEIPSTSTHVNTCNTETWHPGETTNSHTLHITVETSLYK